MTSGGMAINEAILTSWSLSHRQVDGSVPTILNYTRIVTIAIRKSGFADDEQGRCAY